jgi:hypothetical protein
VPGRDDTILRKIEDLLRNAAGRFEETRGACCNVTDDVRRFGDGGLQAVASQILQHWERNSPRA